MPISRPGPRKVRSSRYRLALALDPLVLVGESDRRLCRQLAALFRRKGYRVRVHRSALDLLHHLFEAPGDMDAPELVVLGVTPGAEPTLELLGAMGTASGVPPALVIVPVEAAELREAAFHNGAALVVERPQALGVLASAVPEAMELESAAGE